jgi:uncharacterized protein (TIGR02722 family)
MNLLNRPRIFVLLLVIALMAFAGCATTPKIERTAVETTIDVSGRWNDTDSRMVSEAMIADCLNRPWLNSFVSSRQGRQPDVIVGRVVNKSHEHINVQTFIKDLEMALINSGRVNFVASRTERTGVREEREDMAIHASDQSMKGPGQEAGADYMLIGSLNSITDEAGGKKVVYYQVNLELIDMSNNRKAWVGQKEIKKFIKKSKVGW